MTDPYYQDDQATLYLGDALDVLRTLPDGSINCCVTSPPYFGLRDYGVDGQIGAEPSPAEFVAALVAVFAEVRRVLADDGTLWLNLGDSYYSGRGNPGPNSDDEKNPARRGWVRPVDRPGQDWGRPKSLLMIPERVAITMIDDGWTLRNKNVWHKPVETTGERPGNKPDSIAAYAAGTGTEKGARRWGGNPGSTLLEVHEKRNPGDVWTIPTQPFSAAHFAVFPVEIPRRAIAAGCKPGGTVLDPFSGSGTTGLAAAQLGRRYVGIDLNREYLDLSLRTRLSQPSLTAEAADITDLNGGAA